jgi:hypothetical protein
MDAMCSGIPIDCRSLDSQISLLDRVCDDLQLDDYTSGQCARKLNNASRIHSQKKREHALMALAQASKRWECRNEKLKTGETAVADEIEIVFDQSKEEDEKSGSLWDGLTLWEAKTPGSTPKRLKRKRERKRILGSHIVVSSPPPSLCPKKTGKTPRVDASTVDNSTLPTDVSTDKQGREEKKDPWHVISSRGHVFRSKLNRRGGSRTVFNEAEAPTAGQCNDVSSMKQMGIEPSVVVHDDVGSRNLPPVKDIRKGTILKNPTSCESTGDQPPMSSTLSDDDDRKPGLNILLTRVPVHPETPSREGRELACHNRMSHEDVSENRGESTSKEPFPSKSCLAQAKKIFQGSTSKHEHKGASYRSDGTANQSDIGVEIMQGDSAVELRPSHQSSAGSDDDTGKQLSVAETCRSSTGTELSGNVRMPKPEDAEAQIDKVEESLELNLSQSIAHTPTFLTPPLRDSSLYDSEGNKISPGTLKRISLTSETRRTTSKGVTPKPKMAQEAPSKLLADGVRSKDGLASRKSISVAEPIITSGRPSVKDLVKAIDGREVLSRKVEKKKVLRIFGTQKKQVGTTTLQKHNERPASHAVRRTPPLTRSCGSDLGPMKCPTSRIQGPSSRAAMPVPMRRTVSLSVIERNKVSSIDSNQLGSLDLEPSILAPTGEPRIPSVQVEGAAKTLEEEPSSTFTRPKIDAVEPLKTKVFMSTVDTGNEYKLETQPLIEFSPIDFPIVSKQICSADQLAREFVIQGANQDIPVVLYPLLDFNPCDKVFTFPTDVEDHTFGKKRPQVPPRAPKLRKVTGAKDNRQSSRSQSHSTASSAPDFVSKEELSDGGIEVALTESKNVLNSGPIGKQLLGYVSHSGCMKRQEVNQSSEMVPTTAKESVLSSEAEIKIRDELTESTHSTEREQEMSLFGNDLTHQESELSENKNSLNAITNHGETLMTKVLSKGRVISNSDTTVDAVHEPSVEIDVSELLEEAASSPKDRLDGSRSQGGTRMTKALLRTRNVACETTTDAVYEPSVEVNDRELLRKTPNLKKRVTFLTWHVTPITSANSKTPQSQLKSILRPSSSPFLSSEYSTAIPRQNSSEPAIERTISGTPKAQAKVDTLAGNCETPKMSNRITHPNVSFVDKIIGKKKSKKRLVDQALGEISRSDLADERQPMPTTRVESSLSASDAQMREKTPEAEGIELQATPRATERTPSELSRIGAFLGPKSLTGQVRALKKRRPPTKENAKRPGCDDPHPVTHTLKEDHVTSGIHLKQRRPRGTDTSTSMATAGGASPEGREAALSTKSSVPWQRTSTPTSEGRPAIPEKLPLSPTASDDEYKFLYDSPPKGGCRQSRNPIQDPKKGERSTSIERVSRWIGSMRPSNSNSKGLSKRDRERILKRHDKGNRRFDDSSLLRKNAPPIEKEVYDLLMEGNKTQEDIYQTLTEIAIARKRPSQSLAQAMNELEREVYHVYSEKCRQKSEKKRARRKEFDRKLMKAIRKKTERVIREENEKTMRDRDKKEPSLFQDAIDFFSSFVVCTEDAGLSPSLPSPPRRSSKSERHGISNEEVVVSSPGKDRRTFFA